MRYCRRILVVACLLGFAWLPLTASADRCDNHWRWAERYARQLQEGGTSSQVRRWKEERRKYLERHRECRKGRESAPEVRTASGRGEDRHNKPDYQKNRTSKSRDAKTQRLLKTCNYWVAEYNRQPTDTRRSYRDTACRALREAERRTQRPTASLAPHRRSLEECIKPGNQLDNEVQACLEGRQEPYWREE